MDRFPNIRRVACISTSRADSGIYRPLWTKLITSGFDTHCLAGGTHLNPGFGSTIDDIRVIDGLTVTPVEHELANDSVVGVAKFAGGATPAFARALSSVNPDLVFVLGDRVEMLTATVAALLHRVPIAHLHGGERTIGAVDDKCRDAITMLADYHFPAMPAYAAQLRSMGIADEQVFCVGALAVDTLVDFKPLPLAELESIVGINFSNSTTLVLFHAETRCALPAREQVQFVIAALQDIPGPLLILGVNADHGRDTITRAFVEFAERRDDAHVIPSVSPRVFHSCMAYARCLIGNSSSGIIEAASHRLPVVNIGDRQKGRIRGRNVIDVPFESNRIRDAIGNGASRAFRNGLSDLVNPYGDGRAAERIVAAIRNEPVVQFASNHA